MKNINKIFYLLIVLCIFFINSDVYAVEYSVKELIPVYDEATVYSETFNYNGVKFVTGPDGKANSVLKFSSITNNTTIRKSPSFNILLFDGTEKNIGYVTYCGEKDYGSDNTMFYIQGNESSPFEIKVSSRYFGGNEKDYNGIVHEPGEIVYYSFFSDNSYCQIGGYTKYLGLTLKEITGGEVNFDNEDIDKKLKLNELIMYLPYFLIGLVALIGYGLLLNLLYKRMHARTSILSYLPMTNLYIAVKLAFGKGLAWVFYILCVLSFVVAYTSSSLTFTYVGVGFVGVATVIDIIKLVTGKYNMFIIGKKKFDDNSLDSSFTTNSGSRFIDETADSNNNSNNNQMTADDLLRNIDNLREGTFNNNADDNNVNNNINVEQTLDANDVVDISYDSDMPISDSSFTPVSVENNSFTTVNDVEEFNNSFNNNVLTPVSNVASNPNELDDDLPVTNNTSNMNIPKLGEDEVNKDGESELSNFFR